MNLYYSLALNIVPTCVGYVGDVAVTAPVLVESIWKYHPCMLDVLTLAPYRGYGQGLVGSLTGAASSPRVTEAHEGGLITVGHREVSAMA